MKQTPLPMVSGRYFLPKAPELCLKRMPAWVVTSVNSMGPDGRTGGAGVSAAEGDWEDGAEREGAGGCAAQCGEGVSAGCAGGSLEGFCLQPLRKRKAPRMKNG